ncbi:MAG: response regulator transcription factor [Armatimonadetes bacterium]|nr:response regulator transcription factor [Armatimonadota bacterium]
MTQIPTRVLVVDDDEPLREMVAEYLAERDFAVDVEGDGSRGLERASSGDYALLVLDVRLPEMDGFEVLRRLRAGSGTARLPVLMLTAHGDEIDRIVGLELGADDYLAKPFNPRELLARIRAILRRAAPEEIVAEKTAVPEKKGAPSASVLQVGDVELDVDARIARRGGQTVDLCAVEFDLLKTLLCDAGRVVKREDLAREALGRKLMPLDRSLDIHICKLRHKLWPDAGGLERIRTVRGVGYVLTWDAGEK